MTLSAEPTPNLDPDRAGSRAPVTIGIIGCGRIAERVHLPALTRIPGARVTALADPDQDRLRSAAVLAPGARTHVDAEALLGDPNVAAVLIATPPALHGPHAEAAFLAGKHVYVEKPLATRMGEAEAVVAAWRAAGTTGMVGFNFRHGRLQRSLKAELGTGRIGELTAVRTTFTAASRPLPDWVTASHGGGTLLELGSHHVDLVRFLFDDDVAEVWAETSSPDGGTAMLQLRMASGLPVQSFFSLRAADEDRVEVFGRDGKLWFERYTSTRLEWEAPGFAYGRVPQLRRAWRSVRRGAREAVRRPGEPSYRAALREFVAAARSGRAASPDLEDGRRSLAVVEAAETAARSGGWIAVAP